MSIYEIADKLLRGRRPVHELAAPDSAGVYGIYFKNSDRIGGFLAGSDGLIYIGRSANLAEREFDAHFNSKNTGFSTLRRSLGAILKDELGLTAIPRGKGRSDKDYSHYRFKPDGEDGLTAWMEENLEVGIYPTVDYVNVEKQLAAHLKPPLDLLNRANPNRAEIMGLRKRCADEARKGHCA